MGVYNVYQRYDWECEYTASGHWHNFRTEIRTIEIVNASMWNRILLTIDDDRRW